MTGKIEIRYLRVGNARPLYTAGGALFTTVKNMLEYFEHHSNKVVSKKALIRACYDAREKGKGFVDYKERPVV
jgi:hypothetical protein